MNDYRIEAASKEEWARRALDAEAKLAIAVEALGVMADPKNKWNRLHYIRAANAALTKIKGEAE